MTSAPASSQRSFSATRRAPAAWWLAGLAICAALAGCSATIGDACTSNRECGFNHECDTSPPGGYCLIPNCRSNSCPAEAWCASFTYVDRVRTYCLRKCTSDGDCRGGYKCRFDVGTPGGVCFTGPSASTNASVSEPEALTSHADLGTPHVDRTLPSRPSSRRAVRVEPSFSVPRR